MLTCEHCGLEYDPVDLTQVIYHARVPHVPIALVPVAGALRVDTLPEWVFETVREPSPMGIRKVVGVAAAMAALLPEAVEFIQNLLPACRGRSCPCDEPVDCLAPDILRVQRMWRGDVAASEPQELSTRVELPSRDDALVRLSSVAGYYHGLVALAVELMRENLPSSRGVKLDRRMRGWIGQAESYMAKNAKEAAENGQATHEP